VIGYVPVEEYLFFLLQPLLTGLWLYLVLADAGRRAVPDPPAAARCVIGALVYLAVAAAAFGAFLLTRPRAPTWG
jgi:lycopene beta-cyclase